MSLIGREQDISSIRAYFDTAGVRGGALLVSGDAGVGKTAVLDELAARESGAQVLRAAGAQFESEVGYSTLNQLLFPLGDEMPPLNEAHRTALKRALGFDVGPVPDRLVVSNAALMWLRAVAKRQPLLIIVDDLHWVDRASAEVLGFVARRLVGSPIVFLGACRTGERGFFQQSGLNETTLSPLPVPASRALVNENFPDLALLPCAGDCWRRRPATRSRCWSCRPRWTVSSAPTSPPCARRCRSRNASRCCSPAACASCRRRLA